MTCKDDCLYYEVCADFRRNICEADQKRFIEYRMGSDGLCGWFINKADFVEVVRGNWIIHKTESIFHVGCKNATKHISYKCSECGIKSGNNKNYNYCPRCGAKMEGGKAE